MSSLALIVLCGALVAVGVYLILERSLSRIILGLAALGNGINILFLIAGGQLIFVTVSFFGSSIVTMA